MQSWTSSMPSGEAAEPMRTMLEERSLILTMGPGGVGKTTIAAALGLGASHGLGRSATVLTVDPARRLGAVLGVEADAGPVRFVTESVGTCTLIVDPAADGRERFAGAMRALGDGPVNEASVAGVLYEPADVEPDLVLILGPAYSATASSRCSGRRSAQTTSAKTSSA